MPPIPAGGTVAVTGSAGFVGGWCVRLLLEKGYRVKACVRDANDPRKTTFLREMPGFRSGRLTIHSANLDNPGCFDEIFKGCHGVAHISHVTDYKDDKMQKVVDHMVASINKSGSVTRIIVTSSIAAVMAEGDIRELKKRPVLYEDRYPDESNPKRQVYSHGKVVAQRGFSDAAAKSGGMWDAVTCCPADNVGPILSAHQKDYGPWQHNIEMMLRGKYYQEGAYRPWMIVDVRDDAEAHIRLLESVLVQNGERYIAWSTETWKCEDICAGIDRVLPELGHQATAPIDKFPDRIKKREAEFRGIWAGCTLRNDRIKKVTGITFRPFDESLRDCVESLLSVAKVQPKLREGFNKAKL